jgi:hypothetical protein
LSLFKRRVFSLSTISPILNYISVYSVLFLTPFYLIQGRGLPASQAGLILTAQPIIMALTAPVSGTLEVRADYAQSAGSLAVMLYEVRRGGASAMLQLEDQGAGHASTTAVAGRQYYVELQRIDAGQPWLAEAGYPNGFKTKLVVQGSSRFIDFASLIKAYWAKIGVDVDIQPKEAAVSSRCCMIRRPKPCF